MSSSKYSCNEKTADNENVRHVRISEYVPVIKKHTNSFPSLTSFRGCTQRIKPDSLQLSIRRKRALSEHGEVNPTEIELQAQREDGREWRGSNTFHDIDTTFCIGIRNKKTSTMKVIQVGGVYTLRPHITDNKNMPDKTDNDVDMKDSDDEITDEGSDAEKEDKDDDDDSKLDVDERQRKMYTKKRMELLTAFGGKKSLTAVKKYQRDAITDKKVGDNTITQINEAAKQMKSEDLQKGFDINADETTEAAAPPHNKNATIPPEVYPIEGLITPRELAAVLESVDLLIDSAITPNNEEDGEKFKVGNVAEMENPGWHPLVWRLLTSQLSSMDEMNDDLKKRMCCAMHLHYLITMARCKITLKSFDVQQLGEDMGVPDYVLEILTDRFFDTQKEFGSQEIKVKGTRSTHLLVQHAIIMWLYVYDFQPAGLLDLLTEALQLTPKALMVEATGLGCKVRKVKGEQGMRALRLTLPIPLKFPPIRTKKTGRQSKKSIF